MFIDDVSLWCAAVYLFMHILVRGTGQGGAGKEEKRWYKGKLIDVSKFYVKFLTLKALTII